MADLELNPSVDPLTYDEIVTLLSYGPGRGVNVMWFGATGDGTTDDSAAFQDAINWNSITIATAATTAAGNPTLTFGVNLTSALRARINAGSNLNVVNLTNPTSLSEGHTTGATLALQSGTSTTVTLVDGDDVLDTIQIGDEIRFDFPDRGMIFIPPTTEHYVINSPVYLDYEGEMSFAIQGSGHASKIVADIDDDYVFSRRTWNPGGGIKSFRDLRITNNGTGVDGGIWMVGYDGLLIQNCHINAHRCITLKSDATGTHIDSCVLIGSLTSGSWGVFAGNGCTITNCEMTGTDQAIRASSVGLQVIGGRYEVNDTGIMLGMAYDGTTLASVGTFIAGLSMESNNTAVHIKSGSGFTISGISLSSTEDSFGGVDCERGIYVESGSNGVITGCNLGGWWSVASFDGSGSLGGITFINGTLTNAGPGDEVLHPATPQAVQWFHNNNFGTYVGQIASCTVSALPTASSNYNGRIYRVNDANSTTPGRAWSGGVCTTTAVAGSGSNIVPVMCVNDGGTWKWAII